jgi:hypothetical protein
MKKPYPLLSLIIFTTIAVIAAEPPRGGAVAREAMKKLDFLAGSWTGEGSMQLGLGERRTVRVTETGQFKLDGLVFLVEGHGKTKFPGQDTEVTVHHAFATISFDEQSGQFRFRAYTMDGRYLDAEARVGDRKVQWGFEDPRMGTVRYLISLTPEGEWRETGEASRDGGDWRQFFEMRLRKTK